VKGLVFDCTLSAKGGWHALVSTKDQVLVGAEVLILPARPYGWHCKLVHIKSGEVINTLFFTDSPLEGPDKTKGFIWKATPVYVDSK